LFFVEPAAPARVAYDVAGPERLELDAAVLAFRRWLRFRPPRRVRLPDWLFTLGYRLGDVANALGWRAPISSTAQRELVRGAVGDSRGWVEATGIRPRPLAAALAEEPASV